MEEPEYLKESQKSARLRDKSKPKQAEEQEQKDKSIFERLYKEGTKKKEFKQNFEELKLLNDLKDCTFQPSVSATAYLQNTSHLKQNDTKDYQLNTNNT